MPGTDQNTNGIGSLACLSISLSLLPLSVPYAWVYNHTAGGILSTILSSGRAT